MAIPRPQYNPILRLTTAVNHHQDFAPEFFDRSIKLDKRFVRLLKALLVEPNLDLIEVLEKLEMTDVSLETLKLHNQEPYCLECLEKEKQFVRMVLCEESEEHCCPNCGVVRETLLMKRR